MGKIPYLPHKNSSKIPRACYIYIRKMAIDSPTNDFGKAAKGAKATAGMAQKVKQFVQVAKLLIKGGAGPVGWAVAAGQLLSPLIEKVKKAAAIVGGVIALRVFMHIMQLAGLVTGLAFGAISGLPLLLIPGAGPFLYAGWVGFWGYRGFTNPFDTIQLATHPWEIITRPLNWLSQRFSNLGTYFKGGTEYIGSGVGNAASTVFYSAANLATGLASSIWGWGTSLAGNTIGFFGNIASNALGLASTVTSSAAGIVSVAGKVTLGVVGAGSFLVAATNIVQLSTIEGDLAEEISYPGVNELFTITKTVDNSQIATPPVFTPTPVTFTVTITAAANNLTNLQFSDTTNASNGHAFTTSADTCQQINLPPTLTARATWTCTLVVNANASHDSATITNTASFTASTEDAAKTETDAASATVRVGNAPAGCPDGWPTSVGTISQGVRGSTSHNALFALGEEAIDIAGATTTNTSTHATFTGTVNSVNDVDDNGYGIYVDVAGNCDGSNFIARWAHLNSISAGVIPGQPIISGTEIGKVDSTGHVTGPHLHYSFFGLNMSTHIPTSPPEFCDGEIECGVSFP